MKVFVRLSIGMMMVLTIFSCETKENKMLRASVDSLKTELITSMEVAQTLSEVGSLMDSIDQNRNLLNVNMVEGTSYTNYKERMWELNEYVKQTVRKIASLEEVVRKSKSNNSYYASTIKKLKADLESQTLRMTALQQEVESVRGQNAELTETVRLKNEALVERDEMIQLNQQSIASLEQRLQEISIQASTDQADALFKQAQALEIAAQRTKFAPKKKKATSREALELYKLAAQMGKVEAEQKIAALEKSI